MAGLIQALETGKLTLLNTQTQIQTVNHNISKANDKTYHRQMVKLVTNPPLRDGKFLVGIGARIHNIIQNWDPLLEKKFLSSISLEKDYEARAYYLDLVSSYMRDDGEGGISGALKAFWNSWDVFDANPDGAPERQNVVETAKALASMVRESYRELSKLSEDIDNDLSQVEGRVNNLLQQIADYNFRIGFAEASGAHANDLRDGRYALIQELSQYMPLSISSDDDWKTIDIRVEDPISGTSMDLVDGSNWNAITVSADNAGTLTISSVSGTISFSNTQGGRLIGLAQSKRHVADAMNNLDTFASELFNNVIYNGINVFSSPLAEFFDVNITTADLSLGSNSSTTPSQAYQISQLQNTSIPGLGGRTFAEYLSDIQNSIGTAKQSAEDRQDFYSTLKNTMEQKQQNVSGVSIDEELVDLVKLQHLFQAAAKVIQTTSELLDTVVRMV
ncbi:MAG: flagellar hook-associated protein FlgK [Syntrophobacterales bacterium]|nr:flagellar hook-associated protein FlgK [Syntrophobacterales bacterium]